MIGYVEGPLGSGKTSRLLHHTKTLLESVPASSILVLCSNHNRKERFVERLLADINIPLAQMPVYTYAGFVRNTLFNYWPLVEDILKQGQSIIQPHLSGLEDSELILRLLLSQLRTQRHLQGLPPPYEDFPGNDNHILKQIVRRLRQRSENQLTREDMATRSNLLNETCQEETNFLEQQFDRVSYRLRTLDANKQLDVFHSLIKAENPLSSDLRSKVQHLLVDDVDETIHAQQLFIQWMAPSVESLVLAADVDGGSRRGYLNAYPYDWQALKAFRPGPTDILERSDLFYTAGQTLLRNWYQQDNFEVLPPVIQNAPSTMTRLEMLSQVVDDLMTALSSGAKAGDFCIILPKTDFLSLHQLSSRLHRLGLPFQLLSGTQRPSDNPACRAFLTLIHWANGRRWGYAPSAIDLKNCLIHGVDALIWPGIQEASLDALVQSLCSRAIEVIQFPKDSLLPLPSLVPESLYISEPEPSSPSQTDVPPTLNPSPARGEGRPYLNRVEPIESVESDLAKESSLYSAQNDLPLEPSSPLSPGGGGIKGGGELPESTQGFQSHDPIVQASIQKLAIWLEKAQHLSFDRQLFSAFQDLMNHFTSEYKAERNAYRDLNRIIESYIRQKNIFDELLSSQPADTESTPDFDRWWFTQIKNGAVADTPDAPEAIEPDSIIIATPQKLIDAEVYRKRQLWLDITCREWSRSDNAPLYNAWVHSAVWDGSNTAFSEEFNEAVIRARAGHITRSLMLLATEEIQTYASELDDMGGSQESLLEPRLQTTVLLGDTEIQRATLRPDQAPILEYRSGTMAISAVPGAGKTFVNVELLLELIENGVEPDSILVLTYMDAAAKTLLSRLKKKLAGTTRKLPVISTIHSLALRILTENDQALLLNRMPDDMTILDEFARGELLTQVSSATRPESARKESDWLRAIDRAVSHAKMMGLRPADIAASSSKTFRVTEFLPAYEAYEKSLFESGSLDFSDLIRNAISILKTYPDVRARYQERFRFVIEDEAQDSSRTLQEFIQLLGGERPNLIRTGDTNQSITTTFSSAEPAVFRNFILEADSKVLMDQSGRCAPEVMNLANYWIQTASAEAGLEKAFQPVAMKAVEGQNPALIEPLHSQLFTNELAEESWLTQKILDLKIQHPNASIAVLVRNNFQVNRVSGFLQAAGIKAVSLSENINASPVFKRVLNTLRLLANPGDLSLQKAWAKNLQDAGLLPDTKQMQLRLNFLENSSLLYAQPTELEDEWLTQWHYNLIDFSRQTASANLGNLIAKLADILCPSADDRSNGYLCALMAAEILKETRQQMGELSEQSVLSHSTLDIVIARFEAFQRSWRGRKGFGDLLDRHGSEIVQVMTLHKSKGQEFDAVFIPFLQASAFPNQMSAIRFDESDKLIRDLDRVIAAQQGQKVITDQELNSRYVDGKKREKIEEEARLLYVGITRARKALYMTAHQQAYKFQRLQQTEPALAFQKLSAYLHFKAEAQPVLSS